MKKRILLLDDDQALLDIMTLILEDDYEVVCSTNPISGMEMCNSDTSNIDLIITDVMMPGLTGVELLHYCRQCQRDVPFIIITGLPIADTEAINEIVKRQGAYLLRKPFTHSLLKDLVSAIMEHRIIIEMPVTP